MKYTTKSVLVTRLPRKNDNEFKTASIKLFKLNNPHMTNELPVETLEYENVEKVIIKEKEVDYFLEGNDLIINNLEEVNVEKQGNIVIIS
jgi:hypothetical protein